jgi:hypothetical protein
MPDGHLPLFPGLEPQRAPPAAETSVARPKARRPRKPVESPPAPAQEVPPQPEGGEASVSRVIPYPLAKRRTFIKKQANYIANAAPKTMERLLAHTLQVQADTMTKRGIAPDLIAAEIKALEMVLRIELGRRRHHGGAA